jgi:hypothetical protein
VGAGRLIRKILSIVNRHQVSDWCFTIQDGDRFAAAHGSEVLAQTCLQIRNPDLPHDYMMTTTGHQHNAPNRSPPRSGRHARATRIVAVRLISFICALTP